MTTDLFTLDPEPCADALVQHRHQRALIGLIVYSFARVGAMTGMRVEVYYQMAK